MNALVKKPSANRPVLNSVSKNPQPTTMSNKSSSSSKPPVNNNRQRSGTVSTTTKPQIPKDMGVLKRTSVSKSTKK